MARRVSNATEITRQILQILREKELLTETGPDGAALAEATDIITAHLIRKGFPREEVHTVPVTILLSDIRGFSSIANSYPAADVVAMLNRYFAHMGDIITRYEGRIDKLMGDSILVAFGLPEARPDDVERAIACAVEMQLGMSELNDANRALEMPDIFMGIGINTGDVVASELGSDHYNEYTVIGDEVNLASRIESHSLRGQILISDKTYRLTKDYIEVGSPNHIEVKGGLQAVDLYEVFATQRPHYMEVPRREVRKSPRVTISMPLVFQTLANKIVQPEKYHGRILDISYHGIQIKTATRLPVLSEIKMSVAVELFGDKATEVYATILTCDTEGDVYRNSLEFTSISREGQIAIKQFVDQLI
ncbi:MAG: adenylate/guanylate cyclase domain-containing protein [Pseudohongiellaceae bacterium]